MTTARTVLQTNGLIVNARFKSEKPFMPYFDLTKLMTMKTNTFMFKKKKKKGHSTSLLLQRRKISINVRFIKNCSTTNRTVENFGTQ